MHRDIVSRRTEQAIRIFEDVVSGRHFNRPGLAALIDYARPGDIVCVVRLDRLGRSLRELLETIEDLKQGKIDLLSLEEKIDTSSAAGELVFHVFGAIAHFERRLIAERTRDGIESARAKGKRLGRPSLDPEKLDAAFKLIDAGTSTTETANQLGLGRSTLYREMKKKNWRQPCHPISLPLSAYFRTNVHSTLISDNLYGIWVQDASPTISNNMIHVSDVSASRGILCKGSSAPTITNNEFIMISILSGAKVGVNLYDTSSPVIDGNTFEGTGYGFGVKIDGNCTPTIINNTFTGNKYPIYRAGVGQATIQNNTVTNCFRNGYYFKGSIYVNSTFSPNIGMPYILDNLRGLFRYGEKSNDLILIKSQSRRQVQANPSE